MDFVEQPTIGMMLRGKKTLKYLNGALIAAEMGKELKKEVAMCENEKIQSPAVDPDPEIRIQNLEDRVLEVERLVENLRSGLSSRQPMDLGYQNLRGKEVILGD